MLEHSNKIYPIHVSKDKKQNNSYYTNYHFFSSQI